MQSQLVASKKEAIETVYRECVRMSDENYRRESTLHRILNDRAELLTKNVGEKNLYVIASHHGARMALDIAYTQVTQNVFQRPEDWSFIIEGYNPAGQSKDYFPEITFLEKAAGILGIHAGAVVYDFRSDAVMERAAKLMGLTPKQVRAITFLKLFKGMKSLDPKEQTPYLDKQIAEYEAEIPGDVDMEPRNIVHSKVLEATNILSRELFEDWLGNTRATHVLAYCGSDHAEVFI